MHTLSVARVSYNADEYTHAHTRPELQRCDGACNNRNVDLGYTVPTKHSGRHLQQLLSGYLFICPVFNIPIVAKRKSMHA